MAEAVPDTTDAYEDLRGANVGVDVDSGNPGDPDMPGVLERVCNGLDEVIASTR